MNNDSTSNSPAPARVSRFRLRVRYAETDRMGFVYHSNYLIWCEAGRTELMRVAGQPYTELEARGFSLTVAEASLRYHAPARYDEQIVVETTVREVRSRSVLFEYLVSNETTAQRLVSASTKLVCMNNAGRATALPDDIKRLLEAHVS